MLKELWVNRAAKSVCCITLLLLVGCSVAYDEGADQQINSLTKEVDQQLQTWAAQAANGQPVDYNKNVETYGKIKGDMTALRVRLIASPDAPTNRMGDYVQSLADQLGQFSQEHRLKNPITDPAIFIEEEKLLDPQLVLLNAYEVSLKSGASTSTASSNAAAAQKNATGSSGATPK